MYKVFAVEGGYQIFWCPSAPVHFNDKIPYDGKVYTKKQSAYRRCQQLIQGTQGKRGRKRGSSTATHNAA